MAESRVANGNIAPCRFVGYDATTPGGRVLQCTGNTSAVFGISQAEERQPPYTGLQDGLCAIAGETFKVFTFPDKEVYLEIGALGCNAGDFLTPDANGCGVTTTTTGNTLGARAKQQGIAGDRVPVDLLSPAQY